GLRLNGAPQWISQPLFCVKVLPVSVSLSPILIAHLFANLLREIGRVLSIGHCTELFRPLQEVIWLFTFQSRRAVLQKFHIRMVKFLSRIAAKLEGKRRLR